MPLYEYQCTKCDNRFERIQKFSDPLVTVCPVCGGKVERTLSVPAIHFKGSGWYVTDYANKTSSSKSTKPEEKSGGSSGESKSESKSETKTAATESKPSEKK